MPTLSLSTMHRRTRRVTREPLRRRLAGRLRAGSLDARIRAGEPVDGDQTLACRAHRLTSPHMRHLVADGLERSVTRAGHEPRPVISTSVPLQRAAIREAEPSLAALVARLRDDARPVRPQGAALALHLLTDAAAPLHTPSRPGTLRTAALAALHACDRRVDVAR